MSSAFITAELRPPENAALSSVLQSSLNYCPSVVRHGITGEDSITPHRFLQMWTWRELGWTADSWWKYLLAQSKKRSRKCQTWIHSSSKLTVINESIVVMSWQCSCQERKRSIFWFFLWWCLIILSHHKFHIILNSFTVFVALQAGLFF